jgi:hypothetical protein
MVNVLIRSTIKNFTKILRLFSKAASALPDVASGAPEEAVTSSTTHGCPGVDQRVINVLVRPEIKNLTNVPMIVFEGAQRASRGCNWCSGRASATMNWASQ